MACEVGGTACFSFTGDVLYLGTELTVLYKMRLLGKLHSCKITVDNKTAVLDCVLLCYLGDSEVMDFLAGRDQLSSDKTNMQLLSFPSSILLEKHFLYINLYCTSN